jgi:hypothetical protein
MSDTYLKHPSGNYVRRSAKDDPLQRALAESRRRAELTEAERAAEARRNITLPRVKWLERPMP